MIYVIVLLLACTGLSLQAPSQELERDIRSSPRFSFQVKHVCFAIRKGGYKAIQRCLNCIEENFPNADEDATELPAEAKHCVEDLPKVFKPCTDEDPIQIECLETAYRKYLRKAMRIFWKAFLQHFNESQRGVVIQLISWAKMLYKIHDNSEENFQTINSTIAPCREELLSKIESRKRRDAEEEEADGSGDEQQDNPKIQQEEDEDLEEMNRLRKNIDLIGEYLQCKFDAIKADPTSFNIVKEAVKNHPTTVPAMLVNTLYDC